MDPTAIRAVRRRDDFLAEFAAKGWYHSFELPGGEKIDGFVSLETLRERYARYPIPADLRGRRVLDIGAWDGWFSFEAERRGADVTAVDCVDLRTFREIHRRLGSKVDYRTLDLFDLPAAGLGRFDYVFFLGVLYHLKHPLRGLEIVCAATLETALVDSFVTDGDTWREHTDDLPSLEFYETDELGGRLDNWFGPNVSALLALCRAAGFARVERLDARANLASVACHRRWEPVPAGDLAPAPRLESAVNHADFGINFTARRDQYLTCWFSAGCKDLSRDGLRLEVWRFRLPRPLPAPGTGWTLGGQFPVAARPGGRLASCAPAARRHRFQPGASYRRRRAARDPRDRVRSRLRRPHLGTCRGMPRPGTAAKPLAGRTPAECRPQQPRGAPGRSTGGH
jgi:tRNA (mo5U34)-methyltransferase